MMCLKMETKKERFERKLGVEGLLKMRIAVAFVCTFSLLHYIA